MNSYEAIRQILNKCISREPAADGAVRRPIPTGRNEERGSRMGHRDRERLQNYYNIIRDPVSDR